MYQKNDTTALEQGHCHIVPVLFLYVFSHVSILNIFNCIHICQHYSSNKIMI